MSGRVAVIAVHGVADQLPFDTARATADLLIRKRDAKSPGFREEQLRLEVQPLQGPGQPKEAQATEAQPSETKAQTYKLQNNWEAGVKLACEQPGKAAVAENRKVIASAASEVPESSANGKVTDQRQKDEAERQVIVKASREASSQYFAEQLKEYRQKPADTVYQTVCLSAKISGTEVDVHEMYWADLSRVQSGIFQALEELYYVLFAVCNIGRMELDRSQSKSLFPDWSCDWRWVWLRRWEACAERILILFVPLTNACLLLLLVFALPHLIPDDVLVKNKWFLVSMGFGVGLLVGVISFALFSHDRPARASRFLLSGGVGGLVIGLFIAWLPHPPCIRFALAVLLWVICALVLIGLAGLFNRRQPGARKVSYLLAGLVLLAVVGEASHRVHDKNWAIDIGLATAEWTLMGLTVMWATYLFAAFFCSILGWLVVARERNPSPRREAAKRIVWTANLAILVPGMLIIILNLGIWKALLTAREYLPFELIPHTHIHVPAYPYASSLQDLVKIEKSVQSGGDVPIEAHQVPDLLLLNSALPMFVVLGALVAMLLVAAWLLLPAILSEGTTANDPKQEYSRQLGDSLSRAWERMRFWARPFIQWQLIALIVVGLGIAGAKPLVDTTGFELKQLLYVMSGPALWIVGGLFVLLATGMIQYAGLRTVVDVAADVANWLRLHPRDDNPTSRISARYVSLLRYIAQRKDEKGNPYYDRIVIFAHSLGSAITVDILQFLKEHPDPGLARVMSDKEDKLPIYLFTHGCPLRQLLGLRLPISYGWAWHGSKGWQANEEPAGHELLGVVKWVNTYCSGDYVGRYLWHDDAPKTPWEAKRWDNNEVCQAKPDTIPRVERCVGAGAHVHYWDPEPHAAAGTTPSSLPSIKVAEELLELITCKLPT